MVPQTMSKADTKSTDSSTESKSESDDEYTWKVEEKGMYVAKASYDYELGFNSLSVTFDGVRSPDSDYNDKSAWELRDGHDTQGYFDPTDEHVPEKVAVAFRVLAEEL